MKPESSLPHSQKARYVFLTWARLIQSILSQPISLRSILVLYSFLRLGLRGDLLPSGSLTTISYAFLIYPIRATCPTHLTPLIYWI
jgi:hypothetical protein